MASTTTLTSSYNCDILDYIQRYVPVMVMENFQLLLSFSTVFIVCATRFIQKRSYFHPNAKILFKTYHYTLLFYGISMGTAQLYHILTAQLFSNCENLISSRLCFPFRIICSACNILFPLSILAILSERTIASKHLENGYENRTGSIGCFLSYLVTIVSIITSLIIHLPDFLSDRTSEHCIYDPDSYILSDKVNVFLAFLSGLLLLYDVVLLVYNKFQFHRKTYSLAIEFQVNQNLRILYIILPISLLTFTAFLWFSLADYYIFQSVDPERIRLDRMLQNAFPIYTFLASLFSLLVTVLDKKRRKHIPVGNETITSKSTEKDVYFKTLQDQWSRAPTPKISKVQTLSILPRGSIN